MPAHRHSRSSLRTSAAAIASATLIAGGLAGLGYGVYRMVRNYQFHVSPYKVLQHAIASDVEKQQILVLEDSIARTHYTVQTLSTDEEKEEAVVQILSNASVRALAVPVVVSVNTFLAVSVLCSIETIARLKRRKLIAPVHTSILMELNKLAVSMDAFGVVEQEVRESLTAYTKANLRVATSPAAFMQFLQSFLTTELIAIILSQLLTSIQTTIDELNPSSILYLPLLILKDILVENAADPLAKANSFSAYIVEMVTTFFDNVSREFTDLIASKAGFQLAYYTRPLLSLNFTRYFPSIDESFVNSIYLMTKTRLN
ncbi:GiMOMP35 [Giardia duodenalis]|uniref:GiMOMP35 n=1 Tax=Giardia intestinalis (strain ATCC 50803 / WB clone C6) TaxID=184922 RepID=A8B8F2_GIAIC|nr:GiMOMP35 [Giardia intestinalis]KAE8302459.1 GiMOMP35 [Giardia intestinalis]|eukprot:XP_001708604.1 Hypothetical protein GL50803_14939 [Giardia lamblia ATCC 50803]